MRPATQAIVAANITAAFKLIGDHIDFCGLRPNNEYKVFLVPRARIMATECQEMAFFLRVSGHAETFEISRAMS